MSHYINQNVLSHEGYMCCVRVEFRRHFRGLGNVTAVHQPEAGGNCGGEGNAIFHEGQRRRACDILPDCPSLTP